MKKRNDLNSIHHYYHHKGNKNRNFLQQDEQAQQCDGAKWKFISYTQSKYEQFWTENIHDLHQAVCMKSNEQKDEIDVWMKYTTTTTTLQLQQQQPNTSVFSYFTFEDNCTGEILIDYIEPLAGLTRSPLFCLYGDEYVVSKDYLLPSSKKYKRGGSNSSSTSSSREEGKKAFFFDIGASLFNSGTGGSSQAWFMMEVAAYHNVKWNGIFAWEANGLDPVTVWQDIPEHLKSIYHWYNVPVTDDMNKDNPLAFILKITNPEDFVVVKLDIDNSLLEEKLAAQILRNDALIARIDEFYFEHHVNVEPMHPFWGTSFDEVGGKTLIDTYSIFMEFRLNGIRAHSWV